MLIITLGLCMPAQHTRTHPLTNNSIHAHKHTQMINTSGNYEKCTVVYIATQQPAPKVLEPPAAGPVTYRSNVQVSQIMAKYYNSSNTTKLDKDRGTMAFFSPGSHFYSWVSNFFSRNWASPHIKLWLYHLVLLSLLHVLSLTQSYNTHKLTTHTNLQHIQTYDTHKLTIYDTHKLMTYTNL